jgi:hypothetical protein
VRYNLDRRHASQLLEENRQKAPYEIGSKRSSKAATV